jgi:hypothetical protein
MNRLAERGHECHAVYVKNERLLATRGGGDALRCLNATKTRASPNSLRISLPQAVCDRRGNAYA